MSLSLSSFLLLYAVAVVACCLSLFCCACCSCCSCRYWFIQELSTCKQYGLPVKIVCLNNGYLGMVRQWQDMNYESRYSNSYMDSLPDFVKLAESYGHVGFVVESADQLESTLIEAMAIRDKAVFVDVRIDPDEHDYPMQVPNGSMCDMFLSKTERT